MKIIVTAVAFALLVSTAAFAQCGSGYVGLESLLPRNDVDVVFTGDVVSVHEAGPAQIITFRVGRIWKGPVTQQMTIYRALDPQRNTRSPFGSGTKYVVVAHRLDAAEKHALAVEVSEGFGTDPCGSGSRPIAFSAADFPHIGPGHPPVDLKPGVRNPVVVRPERISTVPPVYPPEARIARIAGTVIVDAVVDETGKVGDAKVLRSIPALDQAALDCVRKWELLPALIDDLPVPYPITVTVSFTP